jgi:hypothetical protein
LKEDRLSEDQKPLAGDSLQTPGPLKTDVVELQASVSPALQRFRSCRWRKAPEDGTPECCGHRDVLPLTGTSGFDAEAWCPDCGLYKLRRTPKKRDDYGFQY